MKETDALDEYILQHIDEETDYLKALSGYACQTASSAYGVGPSAREDAEDVCEDDSPQTDSRDRYI